jgi:peptidyl-prolyl cis-trans isomerase SurA
MFMSTPRNTFHALLRISGTFFCILSLAVAAGCRRSAAPASVTADTYALVNGSQISKAEVDKAFQRAQPSSQPLSDEEVQTAKLNVLDQLIVEDLLIAKARELKLEVADKEIDDAYAKFKQNLTQDAIDQELKHRNLTIADVRDGLRRDLLSQKVLQHEVTDKVQVSDAAVTAFFNANRAQYNVPENSYRLAQIVVTPVRDQQPGRAGDDATTPEQAQRKADELMQMLKQGQPFDALARDHSEDPQTAARGGELGLVPVSALKNVAPPLRDAVMKSKPGDVTDVTVGGVHTLVLVLGLETAGQRDLSMPQVRDNIVANLKNHKEQLLRTAYITALRSDANVVNYFARRIVDEQSKTPQSPASQSPTSGSTPAPAPGSK